MKKNIENSDAPTSSADDVRAGERPEAEDRERHERRRGARSITTNAASSATAGASRPIVCAEPQPALSASTSA